MTQLELGFLDLLQGLRGPAGDLFFSYFTQLGDAGAVFILLTVLLLCFRRTRKAGILCATALMLDVLVTNLCLKPLVARPRPFSLRPVELLVATPTDWSFPSGHTAAAFAFAAGVHPLGQKWGFAAYVFAALMGFSRLYLYVHFPTDVLCGAAIGVLCGFVARRLWKKHPERS